MSSRSSNRPIGSPFAELDGTKYRGAFEEIRTAHARLWEHRQHPHFTLHDSAHARSITLKIEAWLSEVFQLGPQDTFILLGAIYLHDIGMQCPSSEILEEETALRGSAPYDHSHLQLIRRAHHTISRKMVEDLLANPRRCPWGHVDTTGVEREICAIALLCEGHASSLEEHMPHEIGSHFVHLPEPTNLSRLLYILRLGDAMDADASRVNNRYAKTHWNAFTPKEKYHTWTHWCVSNIEVRGAGLFIYNYDIPPEYVDLRADIETCAEAPLQDGLREMGFQLRQWGVWTPAVDRTFSECINVHPECPLGPDGRDLLHREAERTRERREQQSLRPKGTFDAYAPVLPQEQTRQSLLDDEKQVYVPLRCRSARDGDLSRDLIVASSEVFASGEVALVLGGYGTGKTFFAIRFLFEQLRNLPTDKEKRLPVLVALRNLHFAQRESADPFDAVLRALDEKGCHPLDRGQFAQSAQKGELLLIFDGLDEVPSAHLPGVADRSLRWCLELAELGNRVLVTSRTGLLSKATRDKCVSLEVLEWDFRDFKAYVERCSRHLIEISPEELVASVERNEHLVILARRPLYARMLVEVGRDIGFLEEGGLTEFDLVGRFIQEAFTRKQPYSVYRNIDDKMDCLTAIAGHLFRSRQAFDTVENLRKAADRVLGHDFNLLNKFFEVEVKVYSLMQPVSEHVVTFSHDTIRDFFLVRYLREQWRHAGASKVEAILAADLLSRGAVDFLVQCFHGREAELRDFAVSALRSGKEGYTLANGVLILAGLDEKICDVVVESCSFVGSDLSSLSFEGTAFRDCQLQGVPFRSATFRDCSFTDCDFFSNDLTDARLLGCSFAGSDLRNLRMDGDIGFAQFAGSSFEDASLDDESNRLVKRCLTLQSKKGNAPAELIEKTFDSLSE